MEGSGFRIGFIGLFIGSFEALECCVPGLPGLPVEIFD